MFFIINHPINCELILSQTLCNECGGQLIYPPLTSSDDVVELVCGVCGLSYGSEPKPPVYPPLGTAPLTDHVSIPPSLGYCRRCGTTMSFARKRRGARPKYCDFCRKQIGNERAKEGMRVLRAKRRNVNDNYLNEDEAQAIIKEPPSLTGSEVPVSSTSLAEGDGRDTANRL